MGISGYVSRNFLLRRARSASDLRKKVAHEKPVVIEAGMSSLKISASMAELVDAHDSKSCELTLVSVRFRLEALWLVEKGLSPSQEPSSLIPTCLLARLIRSSDSCSDLDLFEQAQGIDYSASALFLL